MPFLLSTIVLPAVTKGHDAFSRLLSASRDGVAGYLGRRIAVARLRDLDDRALRYIGFGRFQIETAVYGLHALSGQTDDGIMTIAAAMDPHGRQRTVEMAPWS
jgi:hypothetical protein